MADYNRDWQDNHQQHYSREDDRRRHQREYGEEPNYSITENRGYRDTGRYGGMSSGEGEWQSRYERQMNTGREGDYDYNARSSRRGSDQNYGGISSGYNDFGGAYSSRSGSRNLYDRGYQGMGRRDYENRENRIGGANYDRYGDHGRYPGNYGGHGEFSYDDRYGRSADEYGRPGWGNRGYHGDYRRGTRDYGAGDAEDRSWWDRTTDEVASWFGDEEAERRRERDRRYQGQFRGKGPRNYSRSDERIREDVNDRLSDDPFVDATDIEVNVSNGEVTLTGTVDHRTSKRRAEDLAEAVSGVKNVENRLRVKQFASGDQRTDVSGMDTRSERLGSSSTSPVPGSDRSRVKEGNYSGK